MMNNFIFHELNLIPTFSLSKLGHKMLSQTRNLHFFLSSDLVWSCDFIVLIITFDSNIGIEWFKKIWKANLTMNNFLFHEPSSILTFSLSKMDLKMLSQIWDLSFFGSSDLVWLESPCVLTITFDSDIGIEWFKRMWKANLTMNNFLFHEPNSILTFCSPKMNCKIAWHNTLFLSSLIYISKWHGPF